MGYAGAQLGTRFIATTECSAADDYKQRHRRGDASDDIVLTERLTGVPVAVIDNAIRAAAGHAAPARSPAGCFATAGPSTGCGPSTPCTRSASSRSRSTRRIGAEDYWQAGKSVAQIHDIEPAGQVVQAFAKALGADG